MLGELLNIIGKSV